MTPLTVVSWIQNVERGVTDATEISLVRSAIFEQCDLRLRRFSKLFRIRWFLDQFVERVDRAVPLHDEDGR